MVREPLRFHIYLSGKIISIAIIIISILYLSFLMRLSNFSPVLILLFSLGSFLLMSVWLVIDFLIQKHRLHETYRLLEQLPEKYLAGELLKQPHDLTQQLYFDVIREISHSAIAAVEQAKQEKQEYCEYVESWVHEIKTPLTACSLILANDGDIDKLRRELKRADNEAENILFYARLRTYEKDLQITEVSVMKVCEHALHNEMELLIAAGIRVEPAGDFTVTTDPKQLEFIIKQLLINCAKYCKGCCIRITAVDHILTIEDNGPGIPAHELPRVTQRGFTGSRWRIASGSTGMGLYIVSQLCNRLNIDMKICSVEHEYTRFTFRF